MWLLQFRLLSSITSRHFNSLERFTVLTKAFGREQFCIFLLLMQYHLYLLLICICYTSFRPPLRLPVLHRSLCRKTSYTWSPRQYNHGLPSIDLMFTFLVNREEKGKQGLDNTRFTFFSKNVYRKIVNRNLINCMACT